MPRQREWAHEKATDPRHVDPDNGLLFEIEQLRAEVERLRNTAAAQVVRHAIQIVDIRHEYAEWLCHLGRFGITSERHATDTAMLLRRIANKLEGSSTAARLREVAAVVPGSILRDGEGL